MVVYKSDIKRRYRDGTGCVESHPKRAKVHAQRKFAQGLNSSNFPDKSFIKEKEKVKSNGNSDSAPLLPANVPKTEDFLTFLCFRGTSVLPPRLDFFNVASDPECGSPSTSNQASSMVKVKNEKICGKHSAVKIHPNKYKEKSRKGQRAVASRMDVKRRSGRLARTEALRRSKKIRRPQRVITRRPINSAIQRRIADKKMRAGLRSGGILPAGSYAGLSIFRRPRSDRSNNQTISYPVRKSAIPLGDTSADDDEDKEEDYDEEEEEDDEEEDIDEEEEDHSNVIANKKKTNKEDSLNSKKSKDRKLPRVRTRSSSLKSHSSPARSLKRMPSRKTKVAATAYMEMMNKTLGSPEPETDSNEDDPRDRSKESKGKKEKFNRLVQSSVKTIAKKILPGRNLKDKSLKRVSMISAQRKTLSRHVKSRRVEELSKRRTRSRDKPDVSLPVSKRQGDRNKNKSAADTKEESESEEDGEDEEKVVDEEKKMDTKREVISELSDEGTTGRRSRRFIKGNDEKVKKKNTNAESIKKQTKKPKDSIESSQEGKLGRRSSSKVDLMKTDLKHELIKETISKNSPTRNTRGRESVNKKDVHNQPEDVNLKSSSDDNQTKRRVKDLKAENSVKREINNSKKEKEISKSPSLRGHNSPKALNKKSASETDKKEPEEKSSPVRTKRKNNSTSNEESSKNTPKRKVDESNISLKRRSAVKTKASEKEQQSTENNQDEVKKNNDIDENDNKPRRNSRNSNKEINVKKNITSKKQNSSNDSVVPDVESRPKRLSRKKSEVRTDKDESSDEDTKVKKAVKKDINQTVESKHQNKKINKKSTTPDKMEETDKVKEESTVVKPKSVGRKKNSNIPQSDEEQISKGTPKKKIRKNHENKEPLINDEEEKLKVDSNKKSNLKVVKDIPNKNINENSDNLVGVPSEISKSSKKEDSIDKINLKPIINTKDIDSREGSLEKLDLKGFDEVNAKETESKVDKFIEHMILKTSDDESKSKMRSKFVPTGGGSKDETSTDKTVKSNPVKTRKVQDKSKGKGNNCGNDGNCPSNDSPVVSINNSEPVDNSQNRTSENTTRTKRKSKSEPKDKNAQNDEKHSAEPVKNINGINKETDGKMKLNESQQESKDVSTNNENARKVKKAVESESNHSESKVCLQDSGSKGHEIPSNKRLSVDTSTAASDSKVVSKTTDSASSQSKAKSEMQNKQKPIVKKKFSNEPKVKATLQIKRTQGRSKSESSESEEDIPKRKPKVKDVKTRKKSYKEIKPQAKRGLRELKALDSSQITLGTSRARVAKHSSSSFYYETESSNQFSSSEEDIPSKKTVTNTNKKIGASSQNPESKDDTPKEPMPTVSNVKSSDIVIDEKKLNDIPDDLKDFKSDFVGNDSLLMDPPKGSRHLRQSEVFIPEDVRNIVKDIKESSPKIYDLPSTSTSHPLNVAINENNTSVEIKNSITDHNISFETRTIYEAGDSMDLLASVAEDVSSKMNSLPLEERNLPIEKPDITKSKPKPSSIGETWIQAFKRVKISKSGQLSVVSHSVKPFVRKPFVPQPFSKQQSPVKCETPDVNFKPFDRSSFKSQSSINTPQKQSTLPFKSLNSLPSPSSIPVVKPLASDPILDSSGLKNSTINVPLPPIVNTEIKKEQTINNVLHQQSITKNMSPLKINPAFKHIDKMKEEPHCINESIAPIPIKSIEIGKETTGGKHHNLPLAVEHTLRKMSPVAVSRKPITSSVALKSQIQVPPIDTKDPNIFEKQSKQSKSNRSSPSSGSKSSWLLWKPGDAMVTKPSDLDLMAKKKVNMTMEEIEMWLNDSTSAGIEHSKDCGLFEKNHCECSFRTSGSSMQNSVTMLAEERSKVGRSIVEPPIQLKDIEPKCTSETISAYKVEDYKKKLNSSVCQFKDVKLEVRKDSSAKLKQVTPTKQDKAWKSTRSMTEEEMCEYDFRFERNSNSPRESCSEMSSPTPKDELSSSNDEGIGSHQSERKSIFQKKNRPISKSPCAFNAENESSVYAFEPDSDVPVSKPFRRKNRLSGEDSGRSTSIAVQVNLEPETVLECSTQTEQEDEDSGATYYIPLRRKSVEPQQMIQGVTVKLDADPIGQEHRVTLRAKLVTKPPADFPRPPATSRSLVGRSSGKSGKPEQKVRPLSMSDTKPPVGTVQPTLRPPTDIPSTSQDSFPASTSSKSSQSTQFSSTPLKLPMDNKATSPLQSNAKSLSNSPETTSTSECGFPKVGMTPRIVEAPAFYPTEKEFLDPLEYLNKITPQAEHYGICRIVPPPSFKPECKVSDDMRFTSYNQYVHKMMSRWGPSVKELTAIKKYLATQSIALTHPPWIGGMEVDLPRLYQTVQHCGGLKEVIEKKRWTRVADTMKIPKSAQDRVTKLDDIYCKYLLPYDTLSHTERCKLLEQVEHDWEEKERRILLGESSNNSDDSDSDSDDGLIECITKGRSMALSQFYRIARNTLWMWFGSEGGPPSSQQVETQYWNQVIERTNHVCVHSGSIDCGTWGYGFPTAKTSSTSKHPWNLKVLTNHSSSVLRSLPPLMGVTVPTLHVGMLFSTFCWYRDPHGLPWIEYLHTGANKIWYGVPDSWTNELRGAIKSVLPSIVRESPVWLPSDTAMLPPKLLLENGVSVCRTVQEPGQFIVIFPKAYTSAICTGYLVSESVFYAPSSWLATAQLLFKETKESCEPTMFSLEKLLFFIANDARSPLDILIQVCPMIESVRNKEVKERKELRKLGVNNWEKLPKPSKRNSNTQQQEYECNSCRSNLFLSHVNNSSEDANYCLSDALELLNKDESLIKNSKLLYLYDEEEMEELIEKMKNRIDTKTQKKNNSKGNTSSGSGSKT